jgi:predicted TIM-barrel fold metal-dependent hydrolase
MLIDAHCHIFTPRIVENLSAKPVMLEELKLNVHDALPRLAPAALQRSAQENRLDFCLLLPTAPPEKVSEENDRFIGFTEEFPKLRTLGTLHPELHGLSNEIRRIFDLGIRGFKFSSFSQRFDILSGESKAMLREIETLGHNGHDRPVALFDTFATAHSHFGADPDHLTTPSRLAELVQEYEGIDFIAAHMGGLCADFDEIRRALVPAPNLYLDTANAAHTLTEEQFTELLRIHGPSRILFGTDWPWFVHGRERPKIASLLKRAGYRESDQAAVFGGNAERLFGFRAVESVGR